MNTRHLKIYSVCYTAILAAGVCVLFGATPASANTSVNAVIDTNTTFAPIEPYVYGMFIEHIGELMYNGLWSEMLVDRKFYYAVMPKPDEPDNDGPRRFRRGVRPGRWNPIGPIDAVVMDTHQPFVGDHTPLVNLAGDEPRGIQQTGINFIEGNTYNGRIQLAGDVSAQVAIHIVWEDANNVERQTISLGTLASNYQAFTFSFQAERAGPARFEVVGTSQGSFHIGAVSLMPADNLDGFRPDAIAALKGLRSGVYRFPGGNFVSAHEWRDAIGDPDRRPPTWDPVWRTVQSNDIGTDEFLTLCKLLEVEPYITVNAGLGDAWSAAQYVEYTNGDVTTPMGKQRAANGHAEPYDVKFWGIGNEMWGHNYQYGAMAPKQYMFKHNLFAKAMRKKDPSILLFASGAMPDTLIGSRESLSYGDVLVPEYLSPADWTGMLFTDCFDNFDYLSEHYYNYGNTHFSLAEGKQVPNDPNEPITDWMRRAANHVRIKYEHYFDYKKLLPQLAENPKPMAICEWAYRGGRYPVYPALAWVFHEMFRHSDLIKMANYTFATSLITRDGDKTSLNANGKLFKLYGNHFGSIPVAVSGNSPQPKPTEPFGGEQPKVNAGSDTFPLDVAAAWTTDRKALTVAVINPTESEQSLSLQIRGDELSGKGTLRRMAPDSLTATVMVGQEPGVRIEEQSLDAIPTNPTFAPFSVNLYEFPVR